MSLAKKNDIDFEINLPNHSSLNNDTTLAKVNSTHNKRSEVVAVFLE